MPQPQTKVDYAELVNHLLDKGEVPLGDLPKHLQDPKLLAAAAHAGALELGCRNHSWSGKDKDDKPVLELAEGFSWWNPAKQRSGRKPFAQVLADKLPAHPELKWHVRLAGDALHPVS